MKRNETVFLVKFLFQDMIAEMEKNCMCCKNKNSNDQDDDSKIQVH